MLINALIVKNKFRKSKKTGGIKISVSFVVKIGGVNTENIHPIHTCMTIQQKYFAWVSILKKAKR